MVSYQQEVIFVTTGELIKAARLKAGLTQRELSDKLNVSFVNISQWENGTRNPKIETLQRIADALQIPVFELMESTGDSAFSEIKLFRYLTNEQINEIIDRSTKASRFTETIDRLLEDSTVEDERLNSIIENYHQLNEAGQQQLAGQAESLTYIPKYKKRDPASDGAKK